MIVKPMWTLIDAKYPFFRVGTDYFTRLTPARRWAKLKQLSVEQWIPVDQRGEEKEKCFRPI